jgi:class 3 adenylate cyclase
VHLEGRTVSAGDRVVRRLAAILAIDMVGYSRHMEVDEAGTLARQKAHCQEQIDPVLHEYGGRVAKTTGDGLLVEFGSLTVQYKYNERSPRSKPRNPRNSELSIVRALISATSLSRTTTSLATE